MANKNNTTLPPKMIKCAKRLVSCEFDGNISKLCEQLGISRSTFYKWYEKKEFKDYVKHLIKDYTESELVGVWKAVVEAAKKGNAQALKLFFDLKNLQNQDGDAGSGVVFISGEDKIEE